MNSLQQLGALFLTTSLLSSSSIVQAQNLPPELKRSKRNSIDASLPEVLRPVVEKAAQAELDKKRGTGNALQILRAEREKYQDSPTTLTSLELRIAATVLRARFLQNKKAEASARTQHALSTFARLDLTEPGLPGWLNKTFKQFPAVRRKATGRKNPVRVAILGRGTGINKDKIYKQLKSMFRPLGIELQKTSVKKAKYLISLASDEVRSPNTKGTVVRVMLRINAREKTSQPWRQSYYRTSKAKKLEDALTENITWLLKIGGRDLLFDWLRVHGLSDTYFSLDREGKGKKQEHRHDHSKHRGHNHGHGHSKHRGHNHGKDHSKHRGHNHGHKH